MLHLNLSVSGLICFLFLKIGTIKLGIRKYGLELGFGRYLLMQTKSFKDLLVTNGYLRGGF